MRLADVRNGLEVILDGRKVGTLAQSQDGRVAYSFVRYVP